jgi:hypothetical protein
MDPISAVVTALALGAAAALRELSSEVVKDAYVGLKVLIQRKYNHVSLAQLEEKPESKNRRGVVEEELAAAGAEHDEELLHQAKVVMDAVQHTPEAAAAIGVDLEDIKAAALRIADIVAAGGTATAVKLKHGEFGGNVDISGIRAGQSESPSLKKA